MCNKKLSCLRSFMHPLDRHEIRIVLDGNSCKKIYFHLFSLFSVFNHNFIIHTYLTHTPASEKPVASHTEFLIHKLIIVLCLFCSQIVPENDHFSVTVFHDDSTAVNVFWPSCTVGSTTRFRVYPCAIAYSLFDTRVKIYSK